MPRRQTCPHETVIKTPDLPEGVLHHEAQRLLGEISSMRRAPTTPRLSPRQQRFVEEFLLDLNATQAALGAGVCGSWGAVSSDTAASKS